MLICGGTGFIGRNLVERFAADERYEVTASHFRRPPVPVPQTRWVQADLRDPSAIDRALEGVDVVLQAAAVTSGVNDVFTRPHIHIADNAVMNSYLFRGAHEHGVRHVVFFSCTVMLPTSERPLSEDDFDANVEIHPRYFGPAWTKLYAEKMCEFYSRLGQTKFTAVRHSNVYGPHDKFDLDRSHVLGATVTKVMTSPDVVNVWGSGEESRDFVYIDDLADLVQRAIERQAAPFAVYNCGAGVPVTVNDLVSRVIAASGKSLDVRHDRSKPSIAVSPFLDCGKAERELGWRPRVSLGEGLARTVEWWRQQFQGQTTAAAVQSNG